MTALCGQGRLMKLSEIKRSTAAAIADNALSSSDAEQLAFDWGGIPINCDFARALFVLPDQSLLAITTHFYVIPSPSHQLP